MRYFLYFFLFCCSSILASAQERQPMAERTISAPDWEKATKGLDYSKEKPDEPKEPKEQRNLPNIDFTGIGSFIQILVIGLGLALLAWAIYAFIEQPSNRRITDKDKITIENLEEHLEESDLERFLREALTNGQYSAAIRIHFLQLMKSLNEKGFVKWAKEKTNRDYLQELNAAPFFADMRKQTRIYEKVWYGNMEVDKALYEALAPDFQALLTRIQ